MRSAVFLKKVRSRAYDAPSTFSLTILLGKEVQTMAIVYATLIIKGKKTLDQVPALIKPQVEKS